MMFKKSPRKSARDDMRILIIGSGFAGLAMAIRLQEAGFSNYAILEKGDEVGGTWRDNTYPGAACDVQSFLYSFSFEPKADWSRMFAEQAEILDYMRACATKYGLYDKIRFNHEVTAATYVEADGTWRVELASGEELTADALVSAGGPLSQVNIPAIPGRDDFKGPAFHTAEWRHDVDLAGKRVAVVGTGASAIQVVPELAKIASKVTVFQRTPPWVMPKPDRAISAREQELFARVPAAQKLARRAIYWTLESRATFFLHEPRVLKFLQKISLWNMKKSVKDPALVEAVTPNYNMGCKRILVSNDYYPALAKEHVEVVTSAASEIRTSSIVDASGVEHEVDAIVYATGFYASENMIPFDVRGRDGRTLVEGWGETGAEAYKGTVVKNFPNLFFIIGPNTGLGHSSMIFMIESMVTYAVSAIKSLQASGARSIEVREDVQTAYNKRLQERMAKTVWQSGGCVSWYQTASGKNTTLWPGYTFEFRLRTQNFDPSVFRYEEAPAKPRRSLANRVFSLVD